MVVVFALSLGASAVYAIVSIVERLTRETALADQTATIHRPLAARPGFDLTYQLLGFVFALAPVALVMFLLWRETRPRLGNLGLGVNPGGERWAWGKETLGGAGLAALIGIPGLILYVVARELGINANVVPAALDAHWWTVPVLILQALRASLVEELIVVAYLFDRFKRLGMSAAVTIAVSAMIRATYHLYQGFGGFIGNLIMGLVFGWVFRRSGRALPLIVAHWVLDIVSFVGFPLAVAWWPQFFAPA